MKYGRLLLAGATALSFSTLTLAGEGKHEQQSQSGQNPELVKQAQEKLNVQADGKLGPQTKSKLKEFQQSKGLPANGQLTTETAAALGIGESGSAATGGSASPSSASPAGASTKN